MENKVIIHQKYDTDKTTLEELVKLHNLLVDTLPEDYIVITTPTDIRKISGGDVVISIDAKAYTYSELIDIIEKAWVYDELNK